MADLIIHRSLSAVSSPRSGVATVGHIVTRKIALLEIDGDAGGDQVNGTYHVVIPKSLNKDGLLILDTYAIVTEVFAQDTTQTVVTIRSNDGTSQTTHATVTSTNSDVLSSLQDSSHTVRWEAQADGTSLTTTIERIVLADRDIELALTTTGSDAGTTTGRLLVFIEFIALPRRESEIQ